MSKLTDLKKELESGKFIQNCQNYRKYTAKDWMEEYTLELAKSHAKRLDEIALKAMSPLERFIAKKFPQWLARLLLKYEFGQEGDEMVLYRKGVEVARCKT